MPKDAWVIHKIFDTAASSAGVNPEKSQSQLTVYFSIAMLKKKAEGSEMSQIWQKWSFPIPPPQFDAGKGVREKASKWATTEIMFNEEVVFLTQRKYQRNHEWLR